MFTELAAFYTLNKILAFAGGLVWANVAYNLFKKNKNKLATSKVGNVKSLKGLLGPDGIRISKNIQLSEKMSMEHPIILGPTGAGKSTSYFIPNLLSDNLKGSIIVSDPKGELYKLTHKYQESLGRKTILFKPLDHGISYNPLTNCRTDREVMQLTQNLLINGSLTFEIQTGKKASGIEWLQMSQSLLCASLLHSRYLKKDIRYALDLIIENDREKLEEIFNSSIESVRTQYNVFKMCLESDRTMASIKITLSSNLQLFTDQLSITNNNFSAADLRKTPTVLYISYPENQALYLSPFMACFYSQLIDHLIDSYIPASYPIYFLFDEFANIGQLSNFVQNISTARSRKISFTICLQSITQLIQIYGLHNAYAILNNCKTKIILPGLSDIETLKYASELCGETEITLTENNHVHKVKKLLFTYDEIRRLETDQLLIICSNRLPLLSTADIYYLNKEYLEKAGE